MVLICLNCYTVYAVQKAGNGTMFKIWSHDKVCFLALLLNFRVNICLLFIISTILLEPSCEATITNTGDISIQVLITASIN